MGACQAGVLHALRGSEGWGEGGGSGPVPGDVTLGFIKGAG